MLDKDFNWCFEHEKLFREWLTDIYCSAGPDDYDLRLDKETIFSLWQKAKEYALEIANSEEPVRLFDSTMTGIIIKNPDYKVFIIMFICSMFLISDNEILKCLGKDRERVYGMLPSYNDWTLVNSFEDVFKHILDGWIKSDYDYSLPDGGIKDETITQTDETEAGTKTITRTEERDFKWCFEHEILFRDWWSDINEYDLDIDLRLDKETIFSLWQKAKEYALEIASSKDPDILFLITTSDIIKKNPDNKDFIIMFICSMFLISDNETLKCLGKNPIQAYRKIPSSDVYYTLEASFERLYKLILDVLIKSDYDYSLPDGGIKDETQTITETDETETETDETITNETKTITITNETKTITITKTESVDVILQNYKPFNNEYFISAMQKAIEKGWIKIKDGKCEWIGPTRIGTKKIKGYSNSALVYFIGKGLNFKTDVERVKDAETGKMKYQLTSDSVENARDRFPREEIELLFGKKYFFCEWKQIFTANKKQEWRKVIDKFFDENKQNIENNIDNIIDNNIS